MSSVLRGTSGRHSRPLGTIGGGCAGHVMLLAGRKKVHFCGMPDRINMGPASEPGQSRFQIGNDEENGAILEGQRNTEVCFSALRCFELLVFLP